MHSETIKVWDPFVRIFHWSLVLFFTAAYISGESDAETIHVWAGYIITGLIAARLIWGLIGTTHARFSDFFYRPAEIIAYLKSLMSRHPKHYLGHNPAGAVMAISLMPVSVGLITGRMS